MDKRKPVLQNRLPLSKAVVLRALLSANSETSENIISIMPFTPIVFSQKFTTHKTKKYRETPALKFKTTILRVFYLIRENSVGQMTQDFVEIMHVSLMTMFTCIYPGIQHLAVEKNTNRFAKIFNPIDDIDNKQIAKQISDQKRRQP